MTTSEAARLRASSRYLGAMRGESAKVLGRPNVCLALLACLPGVVIVQYWLGYSRYRQIDAGLVDTDASADWILSTLLPGEFVISSLSEFPQLVPATVVVIGALLMGGEHGSDTLKLSLTQGPKRTEVLAAKATVVLGALATALALSFATAATAATLIALIEGQALAYPEPGHVLAGFGAALLILAAWASIGLLSATLVRNAGLAMGLGLTHLLAVESTLAQLAETSDAIASVAQYLMIPSMLSLLVSMEDNTVAAGVNLPVWRAALTLGCHAVAALAVSALALRRVDVT